jgi:hypothetical protein
LPVTDIMAARETAAHLVTEFAGRARAFHHALFALQQSQDRQCDRRLIHQHGLIYYLSRNRKSIRSHDRYRKAVTQRGINRSADGGTIRQGRREARGVVGLHANDLHRRLNGLHGATQPGNQSGAANGTNHHIHLRHLFQNLQPHRARSRDHVRIVKPVDVGEVPLGSKLIRPVFCLGNILAVKLNVSPHPSAPLLLHQRGKYGHHHRDGDPQITPVESQRQRMVPRAGGNHSPPTDFFR